MPEYKPLILYRDTPLDEPWPITGVFGQVEGAWTPDRPHLGVDFGCASGTPVLATCYGRVTTLSVHDGSFGTYVLIDCTTANRETTEWYMLHAHLSRSNVADGDLVRPGDRLGLSGATGFVTGAHLHWQMCRNRRDFPRDISLMADPFSFPVAHANPPPPPMTQEDFFAAVCTGLGLEPTPWRLAVFEEWARMESSGALFEKARNPLATTRLSANTPLDTGFEIGFGPGNWNAVPVRVYATYTAGIVATVETLSLSYYADIRRALKDQTSYPETLDDFQTWIGSPGYAAHMVAFMLTLQADRGDGAPSTDGLTPAALNEALQKRMALTRLANNPDLPTVERAYNVLQTEGLL